MQQVDNFTLFEDYDSANEQWSLHPKLNFKDIKLATSHRVSVFDLISELLDLRMVTADKRFGDAIDALRDSDLVVGYNWKNPSIFESFDKLEDRVKQSAISLVEILISEGLSRRLAYANCAAHFRWPGNSFEAAVKTLERLHRESSSAGVIGHSAGKCPMTPDRR